MSRPQAGELDALAQANFSPDEIHALGHAIEERVRALDSKLVDARFRMKPVPSGAVEEIEALHSAAAKILAAYADRDL